MPSPAKFNIYFSGDIKMKGMRQILKLPDLKVFLSLTNKEPNESNNEKAIINVRYHYNFKFLNINSKENFYFQAN